jgi:hypothetical protein
VVRHGNDFNEVGAIKIDDAEWKLVQRIPAKAPV